MSSIFKKRAKGGPEDRFKRKLLTRVLTKLFLSRQSMTIFGVTSLAIFVKNRIYESKPPLILDNTTGKQDVVIIGGGLSGLATAYYLSQNERNNVILLEKNRKVA